MAPEEKLYQQLHALSMNMWWAWNPSVIKLFRDIDPRVFVRPSTIRSGW